jgi:uncharacterized protein YndB with AHSA1/START domain
MNLTDTEDQVASKAENVGMTPATSISRSRFIGASLDEVWETLAAFDQIGRWAKKVDQASYATAVTHGLGAARKVRAGRITVLETITEWAPPEHLAYSIAGLPPVARRVTNSWQLDQAVGGTRVTLTTIVDPKPRALGRLAATVLRHVLARTSVQLLDGLAEYWRARASPSGRS